MSYSDFSIEEVKARFNVRLDETLDLFATVPASEVSPLLRETLAENVPLALAISTEKARSELIITPVLLEAEYHIKEVGRVVGIIMSMLKGGAGEVRLAPPSPHEGVAHHSANNAST